MLLAMSDCLQERPYAFCICCLRLASRLSRKRGKRACRNLLWLLPLCVLWANLHQGVLVLVGFLAVYGLGDALGALQGHPGSCLAALESCWVWRRPARRR